MSVVEWGLEQQVVEAAIEFTTESEAFHYTMGAVTSSAVVGASQSEKAKANAKWLIEKTPVISHMIKIKKSLKNIWNRMCH